MSVKDIFKKITSEISERHKYIHGEKGILEKHHEKLKQWHPEKDGYEFVRTAGLGTIDLFWVLYCLAKYTKQDVTTGFNKVFINNAITDKLKNRNQNTEIKETDSEFKQFFKNLKKSHPQAAARLHLWMLYTLFTVLTVGGIKIVQHKDDIKEVYKELVFRFQKKKKYNPSDKNFTQDFLENNWEEIVIGLLELETYYDEPVRNIGESRYTYGPGCTWVYDDGIQYPCIGEHKKLAENFSEQDRWNQIKQHCMYPGESLSNTRCAFHQHGFKEVSANQILGVFFAGYQRPSGVVDSYKQDGKTLKYSGVVRKLKNAGKDEQKIADAFIAGSEVPSIWRIGTNKRRWWCAMLYMGKIKIEDFINMDRDAFSKVDISKIMKNGHFVYDEQTIEYALNRKNPSKGTVKDFILSRRILDNENTVHISRKEKNKATAFNDGILKIKNRQNTDVYDATYDYLA